MIDPTKAQAALDKFEAIAAPARDAYAAEKAAAHNERMAGLQPFYAAYNAEIEALEQQLAKDIEPIETRFASRMADALAAYRGQVKPAEVEFGLTDISRDVVMPTPDAMVADA